MVGLPGNIVYEPDNVAGHVGPASRDLGDCRAKRLFLDHFIVEETPNNIHQVVTPCECD
jgi:hypothetical protein